MSVGVFPLQYASVRDVDSALRSMVSPADAPTAAAPAAPAALRVRRRGRPRRKRRPPCRGTPLLGAMRVIPDGAAEQPDRHYTRAAYLDEIKVWIERLDRPSGTGDGAAALRLSGTDGSATHLAGVLNALLAASPGPRAWRRIPASRPVCAASPAPPGSRCRP